MSSKLPAAEKGSPPRIRGKRPKTFAHAVKKGITPAHAGKTRRIPGQIPGDWDHPRACGENHELTLGMGFREGSPPRMRGKPFRRYTSKSRTGITPAHAGKTPLLFTLRPRPRDHPRACGENFRPPREGPLQRGSPPRMRGKLLAAQIIAGRMGITPAHAGKTFFDEAIDRLPRDHPRACGENTTGSSVSPSSRGSPPRMRGKLLPVDKLFNRFGITPAHAGKTEVHSVLPQRLRDHPRACGENVSGMDFIVPLAGSPPRMRGKQVPPFIWRVNAGITPAHAGKTAYSAEHDAERRDHPRACGEN